jgi:uncharacterized protein YdhG (YjbR/CyaY superfamily)
MIQQMAKVNFKSIDEYIGTFSGDVRAKLEEMREIIAKTVPEAEETINYQIPTYKINNRNLVHFAGFKGHIGFYPAPSAISEFKKELASYKQAKGSVQFPIDQKLPVELIENMVKFRVKEEAK